MKLSAFITITRPEERGDTYKECKAMAEDIFDEVIVIDGEKTWPFDFNWPIIGEHFQRGYEQSTGDWVFHLDTDFFFHEQDKDGIREAISINNTHPALSFWKYQFIQPDRYLLKSRLVLAVNKGLFGNRIRFNSGGDLCQPSLDGEYIKPETVPEARIPFYNYEKPTKTLKQIKEDVMRMELAYRRHFNQNLYGTDPIEGWFNMVRGRYKKGGETKFTHPKYIASTLHSLSPDQFGYNGFGKL